MTDSFNRPIETTVRKGDDYMSPRQRVLYCQFQYPEFVDEFVSTLTSTVRPGPDSFRHVAIASAFVKDRIEYERTGPFPRGIDHMLKNEQCGDCVDQSILLMSLLDALGVTSRYCCFRQSDRQVGHCVIEVRAPPTPGSTERISDLLCTMAGNSQTLPVSWDHTEEASWLLLDTTSPLPPGFDRGNAFDVNRDGIQWHDDIDLVCFTAVK